jgi:hypothetical protein
LSRKANIHRLPHQNQRELAGYDHRRFLGRVIEQDGRRPAFTASGRLLGSVRAAADAIGDASGS